MSINGNQNVNAKKRGISLIEAVLYLVIALAVIVGGIVYFNQTRLSSQIDQVSRMMMTVSSQLTSEMAKNSLTVSDEEFETSDYPVNYSIKAGYIPESMLDRTGFEDVIRAPWGGVITFRETAADNGEYRVPVLAARLNNIPETVCVRLGFKGSNGESPLGANVFGVVVHNSYETPSSNSWIVGDEIYAVGPGEMSNAEELANACEDDLDLLIFYSVSRTPSSIPFVLGIDSIGPG